MALNILVVDDSDVIRAMIARTIRLAGIDVGALFEAANGREALGVLEESWIDLVLADLNMPVMTGTEMFDRMRQRPEMSEIPVIVVSTEGAKDRVSDLLNRGVAAWVRKPFTPEQIRDVITGVVTSFTPIAEATTLDDILCPILETLAFVSPDPASPERLPAPLGEILCATIAFTGALNGTITIAAPAELCIEMSANALGGDSAPGSALLQGADALGEIANITCGHVTASLESSRPSDIHPPVVERMDVGDWHTLAEETGTRGYVVEGRPILVWVGLRKRQPARCGQP